jgi:Protein of unknown function (DUF3795)
MEEFILSACGYRCDLCRAFHLNLRGPEDQQEVAAAWKEYYEIDMLPEQITCDGCPSGPREGRELPGKDCRIRKCNAERGLENCGYCDEYPCETLEETMTRVEKTLNRYRNTVSEEERARYFDPYGARANFELLRRTLSEEG